MTKQEALNKAWYKLRDAIDNATPLDNIWPIVMELKAAIDLEVVPKDEQFSETYKRIFSSEKEKSIQDAHAEDSSVCSHSMTATENEKVNHPSHYASGSIECIDAMLSAFGKEAVATFCKLNAFKYNWRSDQKGGNEDIQKAIWYLNKYLELNKEGGEEC